MGLAVRGFWVGGLIWLAGCVSVRVNGFGLWQLGCVLLVEMGRLGWPLFWGWVMTYYWIIHQRAIFGFWGGCKWLWGNGLGAPSEEGR